MLRVPNLNVRPFENKSFASLSNRLTLYIVLLNKPFLYKREQPLIFFTASIYLIQVIFLKVLKVINRFYGTWHNIDERIDWKIYEAFGRSRSLFPVDI